MVEFNDLIIATSEADELDDALQKLARGTAGWREDDDFKAERKGEASAEDGDAVHETKRVKTSKAGCAGSWQEDACTSSQSGAESI